MQGDVEPSRYVDCADARSLRFGSLVTSCLQEGGLAAGVRMPRTVVSPASTLISAFAREPLPCRHHLLRTVISTPRRSVSRLLNDYGRLWATITEGTSACPDSWLVAGYDPGHD
jgi:hypothetical protein